MSSERSTKDPGGQQPEMVKGLDAAARAGGVKPADQSTKATGDTAPEPDSLEREESQAARIYKANAERDTGKKA
jgi:hypothetical protein